MATPEPELAIETDSQPLPRPMPDDLKEKGWKMSRAEGMFRARNDRLGLSGTLVATPEEAIQQASDLDVGKKMVVTPSGPSFEDTVADFAPSDEDPKTAITPVKALTEKTFEDEIAGLRDQLKGDGDPTRGRMISHTLFRLDGGTQPREELNREVIAEYAEAKKRGDVFPPVVAFFDDTWMWLADGFHRYFSDQMLGKNETFTSVYYGTQRDAVLYSLRANASHGLPRSNADKRRAVITLLKDPEWSKWSDNVIATKVSVSQPFVSSLRRELSQNVLSEPDKGPPPFATGSVSAAIGEAFGLRMGDADTSTDVGEALPQPTMRIGADGVARDTTNIGRKSEEREPNAIKVTDKRRVTDPGAPRRTDRTQSLTDLLKGKKLAVSFVWIPGLTGKVNVSVNATNRPDQAARQLIPADDVPRFPESVIKLITAQLQAPSVDTKTAPARKTGSKKLAKKLPHKRPSKVSRLKAPKKKIQSRKTARKK